jgi:hypothetical protein
MPDHPENTNPLPDPETPLSDLVDDDMLGAETDDTDQPLDDPRSSDEELIGTRRVIRERDTEADILEAVEDERPEPSQTPSGGVREDQTILIRQQNEGRLTILPLALGFVGAGGLLLADRVGNGVEFSIGSALVLILGSLILTNVFRFFRSGRRERGLFFIAMTLLVWGFLLALDMSGTTDFSLVQFWPLMVAALGVAFVFTFVFERTHQAGLLFPGILLIFASGIAIAVNEEIISKDLQDFVSDYWMVLLTVLGLLLIPTAMQER